MPHPANVASVTGRTSDLRSPQKLPVPAIPQNTNTLADANWQADFFNPTRRVGLLVACLFIFSRFNMLHEAMALKYGTNAYILIITGVPALAALLLSGGIRRALKSRLTWYWIGFLAFLMVAALFSSWRTASLNIVLPYVRTEFPILLLLAGLILTWNEYWRLLQLLAVAAFICLWIGKAFAKMGYDRLMIGMESGSLSDPNDFSAHLLLLLPFLLLVLFTPGRNLLFRLLSFGGFLYGLYFALSTGSRGALTAIVVTIVYAACRLPGQYRFFLLAVLPVIGGAAIMVLPQSVLIRFAAITASDEPVEQTVSEIRGDAVTSLEGRKYILKQTLYVTLRHPFLGVGPGEFSDTEGTTARQEGRQGAWHNTHNTYTQVSSEVGIPALIFFLMAMIGTFRLTNKTYHRARQQPPSPVNRRIELAAFCLMLSIVAFCTAVFFLSFAYRFQLPALTGLAIALWRTAEHEWSKPQSNQAIA